MQTKRCSPCEQTLPIDQFYKGTGRYGTSSYCKNCIRTYYGSEKRLSTPGFKRCPKCKRVLPATREYWRVSVHRRDGWKSRCKDCLRKPVRVKSQLPPTRVCKKCGVQYPNTDKYFPLSRHGIPTSPCRACIAQKKKEWRANNPEKVKKHKSDSQKRNRENANIRSRRHAHEHPERMNLRVMKRWTAMHGLPFTFTEQDWQRCLDYWDGKCAVCGRSASDGYKIAKDHWIAITDTRPDNPGTVPANIVPLCHINEGTGWGCNNRKGNHDVRAWLTEEFGPAQAAAILSRVEIYFSWVKTQL